MPKGGQGRNPFAGNDSMNSFDEYVMGLVGAGKLSFGQALALRIIKMSVKEYLYFGLGKNGITPEGFLDAYEYLFIGSRQTKTDVRGLATKHQDLHAQRKRLGNLDDKLSNDTDPIRSKTVEPRTFLTHFDLSGLSEKISADTFCSALKKKRRQILGSNRKQVLAYLTQYRDQEWKTLGGCKRGKFRYPRTAIIQALTAPKSPKQVAKLLLFGRKVQKLSKNVSQPARQVGPTYLRYLI